MNTFRLDTDMEYSIMDDIFESRNAAYEGAAAIYENEYGEALEAFSSLFGKKKKDALQIIAGIIKKIFLGAMAIFSAKAVLNLFERKAEKEAAAAAKKAADDAKARKSAEKLMNEMVGINPNAALSEFEAWFKSFTNRSLSRKYKANYDFINNSHIEEAPEVQKIRETLNQVSGKINELKEHFDWYKENCETMEGARTLASKWKQTCNILVARCKECIHTIDDLTETIKHLDINDKDDDSNTSHNARIQEYALKTLATYRNACNEYINTIKGFISWIENS